MSTNISNLLFCKNFGCLHFVTSITIMPTIANRPSTTMTTPTTDLMSVTILTLPNLFLQQSAEHRLQCIYQITN